MDMTCFGGQAFFYYYLFILSVADKMKRESLIIIQRVCDYLLFSHRLTRRPGVNTSGVFHFR